MPRNFQNIISIRLIANFIKLGPPIPKDLEFVTSEEEFYNAYKMICGYEPTGGIDFLKFKTINKDGNIEPVKMWLIDAAYDYFF